MLYRNPTLLYTTQTADLVQAEAQVKEARSVLHASLLKLCPTPTSYNVSMNTRLFIRAKKMREWDRILLLHEI